MLEGKEAPSCPKLMFIFNFMCHLGEFLVDIRKKCGHGELERSLRSIIVRISSTREENVTDGKRRENGYFTATFSWEA